MSGLLRFLRKKKMSFPTTLEGFGYRFNDEGRLLNIETGEPFKFVVKENDHRYNQEHYEALGEVVTQHVYKLLVEECELQKFPVPTDASTTEARSFVFVSKDFYGSEKLLVLIHGSGVVRAGQWARRLIINDCLSSGTQIPFIQRGKKEGYAILVMNTNDNSVPYKNQRMSVRESETPEKHAVHVWNEYVKNTEAKYIAIVAHSYGGVVTTSLFRRYEEDFSQQVFAVALTDSVHFMNNPKNYAALIKVSRNWVASNKPLDEPVSRMGSDIECVSAGAATHEMTSWSSFNSIFDFFKKRLQSVVLEAATPSAALDAGATSEAAGTGAVSTRSDTVGAETSVHVEPSEGPVPKIQRLEPTSVEALERKSSEMVTDVNDKCQISRCMSGMEETGGLQELPKAMSVSEGGGAEVRQLLEVVVEEPNETEEAKKLRKENAD